MADAQFQRSFRVDDLLSVPMYSRALGEEDGPCVLGDVARSNYGFPSRPVPGVMLSFFQAAEVEEILSAYGITMGKTLFVGSTGSFGELVFEEDEVTVTISLLADSVRTTEAGAEWRHLTIEAVFTNAWGAEVSRTGYQFMEKAS
jgi:hypothetical protein